MKVFRHHEKIAAGLGFSFAFATVLSVVDWLSLAFTDLTTFYEIKMLKSALQSKLIRNIL